MKDVQIFNFDNNEVRTVMINGVLWVTVDNYELLPKKIKDSYMGVVYIAQFGDKVKIGKTNDIRTKMRDLKNNANRYYDSEFGLFLISPFHTNYNENDKKLCKYFCKQQKKDTKIFNIKFDDIIKNIPVLEFLDETEKIKLKCDDVKKIFKSLLFDDEMNEEFYINDETDINSMLDKLVSNPDLLIKIATKLKEKQKK